MDVILPEPHSEKKFLECASQLKYSDFNAKMFVFYTSYSDVDVYQLMPEDRLVQLIYGWDVCRLHTRDSITEETRFVAKVLAHHTLQIWFSQEWINCSESLKHIVLLYLRKGCIALSKIDGLCDIDWQYILNFQTCPWRLPYLQKLFANLEQNKHHAIEHPVPAATDEDVTFLMQESLHLIILRLLKLFDAGSWEAVKQLSLRVLSAWLKCNANASCQSLQREKKSIALVGHLYLFTVFVMDDNRGYVIDNMMYNIRFYAQTMQDAPNAENISYTPARLIARVCVRLGLEKDGFFEYIVFKKFKLTLVTPFAVMLEAYTSYMLGNQLLGLMALNEHDFMLHFEHFKVLMHRYVEERENSERFLLNELKKLESQRNSHAAPHTVNLKLNYQQQICKGNRASNIGNYKNCDDDEKPQVDIDEELDRQIDPVFQNVPNNEEVLEFVYQLLAKRNFKGWQFAKIALLLKIVGQKINTIEVWRYHPGLTTQFMLSLEHKLSENYADLAKVFSEHNFMEAEFWLTAFYLNPTSNNFNEVKRCSRFKKKRKEEDEVIIRNAAAPSDMSSHIKYELLSSTIDVDEIVSVTNHDAPVTDYEPVSKALQALRLPRSILKDLLTVVFQPRNKRYSWALDWTALHERCSALVKSTDLKRKFVALTMAEANDRLKFLKIDYAKYKNRPQLDYGTIEEGYENAAATAEAEAELSAEDDEETIKQAAKEKEESAKKRRRNTSRIFWKEVVSEDEDEEEQASDESEAYYTGTGRRTRVRAAAVVANAMISDMDRTMRSGRRSPAPPTAAAIAAAEAAETLEIAETPKPVEETSNTSPGEPSMQSRSFGELLNAQPKHTNETSGFKAFTDIWSFEKDQLSGVNYDNKEVLMESSSLMSKFKSLQSLKRNCKPVTTQTQAPSATLTEKAINHNNAGLEVGRASSRCNSDADSLHSGTSTMALHDDNEMDEEHSGVSKELTPPPASTSDFTMKTEVLQFTEKSLVADEENSKEISVTSTSSDIVAPKSTKQAEREPDDQEEKTICPEIETKDSSNNKTNSEESTINTTRKDSIDSPKAEWYSRLIKECLSRQPHVRLQLLTSQDIEKLRGFRVRVKRTNLVDYYREQTPQATGKPSSIGRKVQTDSDGSSFSTPTSEDDKGTKKFVHITSDSPAPSIGLAVGKARFKQFRRAKHITSDSSVSTEPEEKPRPASKRRRRGHKWTQLSAKCKQQKLPNSGHITADTDVIELSSGSSSPTSPVPVTVNRFPQVFMPLGLHPLYEEEIVPF